MRIGDRHGDQGDGREAGRGSAPRARGPASAATRGRRSMMIATIARPTIQTATATMWIACAATWRLDISATFAWPWLAMPPSTTISSTAIRAPAVLEPVTVAGLGAPELPYSRMNRTAPIAKSANSRAPRSCTSDPKRVSPSTWLMPLASRSADQTPVPRTARALHHQQVALGDHRADREHAEAHPEGVAAPVEDGLLLGRAHARHAPDGRRPHQPAEGQQADQAPQPDDLEEARAGAPGAGLRGAAAAGREVRGRPARRGRCRRRTRPG